MQCLTKAIPAVSRAFGAGRVAIRPVSAVSQRSSLLQKKNFFHSTPRRCADVENDVSYRVHETIAPFPVENFDHYRKDGDANLNRAFTYTVVGGLSAVGVASAKNGVVDLLSTLSASADVLAVANLEYDLASVPEGSTVTVKWRGKPLFIRHRTAAEIDEASSTPMNELKDPQADADRAQKPEYLIVLGICTHLGCVPISNAGDYNGWFCPCHGSHYDTSGRIRKGPAPLNLEIPPYSFTGDTQVLIGN